MSECLFNYLVRLADKKWLLDTRNPWEKLCTPVLMFFYGRRLEAHRAHLKLAWDRDFYKRRVRFLQRQRGALQELILVQASWLQDLGHDPDSNPYIPTGPDGPFQEPEQPHCAERERLLRLSDEDFLNDAAWETTHE